MQEVSQMHHFQDFICMTSGNNASSFKVSIVYLKLNRFFVQRITYKLKGVPPSRFHCTAQKPNARVRSSLMSKRIHNRTKSAMENRWRTHFNSVPLHCECEYFSACQKSYFYASKHHRRFILSEWWWLFMNCASELSIGAELFSNYGTEVDAGRYTSWNCWQDLPSEFPGSSKRHKNSDCLDNLREYIYHSGTLFVSFG